MKKKTKLVILILCLAITTAACSKNGSIKKLPKDTEIQIPEETAKFYGPLTGREYEEGSGLTLRPIAVMMDNEVSARPQTGLYKADIVYEYPVEGGITRYMGIFLEQEVEAIGAVRSARPYFIDKHFDFNAVYLHCGGSTQAYLDIRDLKVDSINDLKGAPVFNRDKTRKAPHNLYTSTAKIRTYMEQKGYENNSVESYFNFSEDFYAPETAIASTGFQLTYQKNYVVGFNYKDGVYYRTINGKPMMDRAEPEIQVTASNIIIENIKTKVLDSAGRLEVNSVGSGEGKLFTGGKVIDITWSKDARKNQTVYKDLNGQEITVNIGNTFIQGMPQNAKLTILE